MIIEIFVNNSGFPYENAKNGKNIRLTKIKIWDIIWNNLKAGTAMAWVFLQVT